MMTAVPPAHSAGSSWLIEPITWNKGTASKLRTSPNGRASSRSTTSAALTTLPWVSMAPFGAPVVPLV